MTNNGNNPGTLPRILFVDDEENLLRAIKRTLAAEPYDIATTSSPRQALEWLRQAEAEGRPYTVVVSDQQMPEMSGTRFLEQARYASADTIRILLTGYTDIKSAIEAINRGAIYRYLEKPWHDDQLKGALIDAVESFSQNLQGQRIAELTRRYQNELLNISASGHYNPDVIPITSHRSAESEQASSSLPLDNVSKAKDTLAKYNLLTRREKDLLYCIVQGYPNQKIADELSISITTVKNHIGNIFRKLEVANRTQAAMLANLAMGQSFAAGALPEQQAV